MTASVCFLWPVFCPLSGNANTAYFSGDKLVSECSGNAFVPPAIIAAGVNHGDISGVLCLEKPAGEAQSGTTAAWLFSGRYRPVFSWPN